MKRPEGSFNIRLGETIKGFLLCPTDRQNFKAFYSICFNHTIAYLRFLKSHGWSLPIEKSEKDNPLVDIVIDVLGTLFQSRPDSPFFMVFDYFRRHGINDLQSADPAEIMWLLSVLIRGHTKKELGKLRVDRDAGAENLERRFKDILRGSEYGRVTDKAGDSELVFYREYENDLRVNNEPLPPGDLRAIVNDNFARAKNRKDWCRAIFLSLNDRSEFRNCLIIRDLLTAIVIVNVEHVELYGWRPATLPSPEMLLVETKFDEARCKALEAVQANHLKKFVDECKISEADADRFRLAIEQYLTDMGQNGNSDLIPAYFRAVMPENTHKEYLRRYKYVFETAMNQAVAEFRRILKE